MRVILPLPILVLLSAASCVVVNDQCNPRNCNGCCNTSGQCVDGNATSSCGNGGNACSVCPGTFTCSLGTCQPANGGGGLGGGTGGGLGGGTGGGLGGGTGGGLGGGTGGGGGLAAGDIVFLWNFQARSCAQTPAVQSVRVTMPGQTLANGGLYQCSNGGTDGIQVLGFAGGAYAYTVEGLSSSNAVLYSASGNVTVNGAVTVNVTLAPSSSGPGSVALSWAFPPNSASQTPNCSQAGVTEVMVAIDSATPQAVPCTQGFGTSVLFDNLTQGMHAITLEARDSNAFVYYRSTGTFTAQTNPSTVTFLLDWAVGSLPLRWSFNNGTTQLGCAQAGVNTMNLNLRDSFGTLVYGTVGVDVPCSDNTVQGTTFPYLSGGAYDVFLQAYGTGGVLYRSNFTTPPSVTVVNGQFPQINAGTTTVLLTP